MRLAPPETIATSRLLLRRWVPADLEPFAALNADPRVMEFFPKLLTRDESDAVAARIRSHFDDKGFGLWAVEIPGVAPFAGFIGLQVPRFEAHFTPCVEIAWRLAAEHWGRGYASEGATAVLRFAFDSLRLPEVVSFTAVVNERSWRVMERTGMTRSPADDFDHPMVDRGHRLERHVLYRARPNSVPPA
jgi:RimJ/RimL family protein N-acetyltransferase